MPKVSVIVPVYNVEEYLPQSIRSVLEQTERDIEIILVDDGSTDGSGALCDAFARSDERVRVIHKANGGLSSARNAGVKIARGNYILLVDGDDRLHRGAVARTLTVMEEHPVDFVQFRYREVLAEDTPEEAAPGGPAVFATGPAALFENLYRLGGEGASACTKLFRRELLEQIPFEPTLHEDEIWCTRAFQQPLTAAYIDDVLYDYVTRQGSIIRGDFKPVRLDLIKVSRERIKALEKLDLTDLLCREYGKLFLAILTLYRDAANAGDRASVQAVREAFTENREGIKNYAGLSGKFGLLFRLMGVRFEAAELYRIYWKIRR